MVTKVFLHDIIQQRYTDFAPDANTPGNKAGKFLITIPYAICSDTIPVSILSQNDGEITMTFFVGTEPSSIYQLCFDKILEICQSLGFEAPEKKDIYAWLPTSFDVVLP